MDPPQLPPGPLGEFLAEHPEYRPLVAYDAGRGGWAMPGWVANAYHAWHLAKFNSPADPAAQVARERRN
jgi:hypothetical protein